MRKQYRLFLILIPLCIALPALAQDGGTSPEAPSDLRSPQAADETHPIYSTDGRWAVSLIIACAALFLAGIVIGPIVRSNVPEAVPQAISHEEDPAADRHESHPTTTPR